MIARPKISRNEWKTTEIGASKVGNFAFFSCPGAHLRGDVFGARHAEEAETLRVMANHCRERNDLQAALAYMERSCSAYTSSLRSGESAAAAPSRAPTALEAARATPLATLAAPAHATQPAPLGPDDALVPDAVPARLKRAPPRSLLNADREDRDPRPPRPRSPGSVPAVVSSRPHCVRHRVETPPRPLPLDDDLIV
jgi:hypothetical protein